MLEKLRSEGSTTRPAPPGAASWCNLSADLQLSSNPRLQAIVNQLFRAADRLPGGTAGAFRYEKLTGDLLPPAGHGQKAANIITHLTKLLKSGELSPQDQAVAMQLIQDLKTALETQRRF